ncbi:hypothetical protein CEP66_00780 [Citrobacter koseri]|nr:hypothetical protein CEP66_00780 [Citrobacter koseri]ATF96566.1 hypothetical protein CO700_05625 [Citrobacter koseri]AVE61305.1 hypothetical protein AM352_20035 [Citrobacter koseri]AVE67761.1 hypothetical protein AM351_07970 [Citrobacter koseri]PNN14842.1 hypothetical protein AL526_020065 [Citrobacter koseri]
MHPDFINGLQGGVNQLPATKGLHPHFGHFYRSSHQLWLCIKPFFDWTFNIKCVLIVINLAVNR